MLQTAYNEENGRKPLAVFDLAIHPTSPHVTFLLEKLKVIKIFDYWNYLGKDILKLFRFVSFNIKIFKID